MFCRGQSEDQTGTTSRRHESSTVVKTPRHLACRLLLFAFLSIIHAAWLSQGQKTSAVTLRCLEVRGAEEEEKGSGGGRVVKCFLSLCAPRVTKSTADAGPDKSRRGRAPFFFSSSSNEVVTLTFPLAYVIPPPKPPPPPPPPLNLRLLSRC